MNRRRKKLFPVLFLSFLFTLVIQIYSPFISNTYSARILHGVDQIQYSWSYYLGQKLGLLYALFTVAVILSMIVALFRPISRYFVIALLVFSTLFQLYYVVSWTLSAGLELNEEYIRNIYYWSIGPEGIRGKIFLNVVQLLLLLVFWAAVYMRDVPTQKPNNFV